MSPGGKRDPCKHPGANPLPHPVSKIRSQKIRDGANHKRQVRFSSRRHGGGTESLPEELRPRQLGSPR